MTEKTKEKFTLSIQGREIDYMYKVVDINEIRFYGKNPRIATILSEYSGKITDEVIDKKLWERNETHRLFRRIQKEGGLIHPILVYQDDVLEGNTRLCCYRHLYNTTKEEKWKHIKCHIILEDLTQNEIYRLLCIEHIEGKIEWEAYEKANLYCKMNEEELMALKQISELVGESPGTVSYRIRAYKLMRKNNVINRSKYSHFEQLVRNPGISTIKRRDPKIEEKVISLIKKEIIPKATDVRLVGDIYKSKKARKRLFVQKENITQVYHDLKAKQPMIDSPIMKNVKELHKNIRKMKRGEREELEQSKRDCMKIKKLVKELIILCGELNIKIHIPKNISEG